MSGLKGISKVTGVIFIAAIIISGAMGYYIAEMTRPPPLPHVNLKLTIRKGIWTDIVDELKIISKFEKKMKSEKGVDVRVFLDTIPHKGYSERLVADVSAGVAGDVIHIPVKFLFPFAESGYLLDITPYVNKWNEWDLYYPTAKNMSTYKGKVYMVPWDTSTKILWYRKDLFKEAGIPVPWQPKTWEDIIETCKILKEKLPSNIVPIRYKRKDYMYTFLRSAGGKLFDPTDDKWIAKSPELLKMFKFFYDLTITYNVSTPRMYIEGWDERRMFQNGELAIIADGCYLWGEKIGPGMAYEIPNREEVVGWAMVPGPGSPGAMEYASLGSAHGWAINSKTKYPDLAWELVKMLSSKEITAIFNARTSHVSPRKDASEVKEYKEDVFLSNFTDTMMAYVVLRPSQPAVDMVFNILKKVHDDVIVLGEKDPEAIMDEYAKRLKETVGEENVKIIP